MRRWIWLICIALSLSSLPAEAAGRFIVRVGNTSAIQIVCLLTGCTVAEGLDGTSGKLFLVTTPDSLDPLMASRLISQTLGVVGIEPDLVAQTSDSAAAIPPALEDNTPISYFGVTVPHGYVYQPATERVRLADMSAAYPTATGAGVVAVLDTGVDPNHPVLKPVLLRGYDFTRNQIGADETSDISLLRQPVVINAGAEWVSRGNGNVDQSTAAVVDQSTAAVVDGPQTSDFGHGTMVSGIIHLVAPTARILPLKVFRSDGTGYTSDIIRGIYFAISAHANVLNMSFHLAAYSPEVATALSIANLSGIVSVAAAGNDGQNCLTYPAALDTVMGVASTTNNDRLSSFSNFGSQLVWVAAPGEGVVTTYPFSTYAAGWGTSFSTPFVSGVAASMLSVNPLSNGFSSAQSTAHAQSMDANAGHGRLDTFQALQDAARNASLIPGLLGLGGR